MNTPLFRRLRELIHPMGQAHINIWAYDKQYVSSKTRSLSHLLNSSLPFPSDLGFPQSPCIARQLHEPGLSRFVTLAFDRFTIDVLL